MTKVARIALAAISATILIAACGGSTMDNPDSLEGQWKIEQIADESGVPTPPVDGTSPFVGFGDVNTDQSNASGNTGCNTFSGPVDIGQDGSYEAGTFMMTLMGCPESLGAQEGLILSHMSSADSWSVDGDTASLSIERSVLLALRRIDTSIEASAWAVTGINNQTGGVQSVAADTEPTLFFEADQVLSGTSGCNSLNGSYTVDGADIAIGPVATTRKFCQSPDGVMEQEQNMTAALANASTYEINGLSLTLRNSDGHTMITARRVPEPRP